jgi:hypothetical protein
MAGGVHNFDASRTEVGDIEPTPALVQCQVGDGSADRNAGTEGGAYRKSGCGKERQKRERCALLKVHIPSEFPDDCLQGCTIIA